MAAAGCNGIAWLRLAAGGGLAIVAGSGVWKMPRRDMSAAHAKHRITGRTTDAWRLGHAGRPWQERLQAFGRGARRFIAVAAPEYPGGPNAFA